MLKSSPIAILLSPQKNDYFNFTADGFYKKNAMAVTVQTLDCQGFTKNNFFAEAPKKPFR
jgi:hypothetical protein